MFRKLVSLSIIFTSLSLFSQNTSNDSIESLEETIVTGYILQQPLLRTPTSVGILNSSNISRQADATLLPALNSLPGVRMEERSPGSYRLSLRGSLLRSPYGVRNVKIYLDEFPLTDAGGNTYLNLLDTRSIGRMEVLKGPHGSLFGANSGGVVLIETATQKADSTNLEFGLRGGSYGMLHQDASLQKRWNTSQFNLNQAFFRSDGYRENAAMRRHYIQASEKWNYRPGSELKFLGFFASHKYETPGGLTAEQYLEDPRQARPAAGPNPGAAEQKAGIENETVFGGISHKFNLTKNFRHLISLFGSHTDFENPFITNYEVRDETNYGVRTYFQLQGAPTQGHVQSWQWNFGLEWQRSHHDITNYDNNGNATIGDLQAADEFRTDNHFYFTGFRANLFNRLTAEAALSLNFYKYHFETLFPEEIPQGESDFSPAWMPRLSVSYLLNSGLAWRASVSRGYSSPTTAEIRPANLVINTGLQAETGWNYETGLRFNSRNKRLQVDASLFYYRMQDAIVRRTDEGGNEFFTNAGGTKQLGWESLISYWLIDIKNSGFLRGLQLTNSYTNNHFEFADYVQESENYTGNRLTGVPYSVLVSGLLMHLPANITISAQHNFTDKIPLNDANSVYADSYHLVQAKAVWQKLLVNGSQLELSVGVDNLLDESYSLGNDINAFGNRFYNPAPLRNFYAGAKIRL